LQDVSALQYSLWRPDFGKLEQIYAAGERTGMEPLPAVRSLTLAALNGSETALRWRVFPLSELQIKDNRR